jgi:rare lipoprotein A
VQPGETLFSLYRRYGVKVDQLKAANGLKSDALKPGQVLKIKRLQ